MTAERILFLLFAIPACTGAIAVVVTQNIVRMAFWLIVSLGSTAALFFLLHADFVAATQLLIYVGGTLVLLIFGVMLTTSAPFLRIRMSMGDLVIAGAVGLAFLAMLTFTVSAVDWDRIALSQVVVDADTFEQAQGDASEETAALLAAYEQDGAGGGYRYPADAELTQDEQAELMRFWEQRGLEFSPRTELGGTGQPLGLALLGLRPDREPVAGGSPAGDGFRVEPLAAEGTEPAPAGGYLLPFEIVSVHLLVVLIGAAYLARAKRRANST
jgi:NADH:ubiquinone oxidoreductase subunit 6 (subunit J)